MTNKYRQFLLDALRITKAKNHDYCSNNNAFHNFSQVTRLNISVEDGMFVRMLDKVARIESLTTKEAKVKEESIKDTFMDLVNYLGILYTYKFAKTGVPITKRLFTKYTVNVTQMDFISFIGRYYIDLGKRKPTQNALSINEIYKQLVDIKLHYSEEKVTDFILNLINTYYNKYIGDKE